MKSILAVSLFLGAHLVFAQSGAWAQCGGIGWSGATTCVSGYTCSKINDCNLFHPSVTPFTLVSNLGIYRLLSMHPRQCLLHARSHHYHIQRQRRRKQYHSRPYGHKFRQPLLRQNSMGQPLLRLRSLFARNPILRCSRQECPRNKGRLRSQRPQLHLARHSCQDSFNQAIPLLHQSSGYKERNCSLRCLRSP
jgi:hypothetical protein